MLFSQQLYRYACCSSALVVRNGPETDDSGTAGCLGDNREDLQVVIPAIIKAVTRSELLFTIYCLSCTVSKRQTAESERQMLPDEV